MTFVEFINSISPKNISGLSSYNKNSVTVIESISFDKITYTIDDLIEMYNKKKVKTYDLIKFKEERSFCVGFDKIRFHSSEHGYLDAFAKYWSHGALDA